MEFTKKRFLLCEGDDDKGFFEALTTHLKIDFQVCHAAECNGEKIGGVTGFAKSLKGMMPLDGFRDTLKALLLVSDNDVFDESFKRVQKALTDNGFTAPINHNTVGEMAGKPVAILMIPNYNYVGDLESLCWPAICEKWPDAERCVTAFLQCSGATSWGKRSSRSKSRTRSATVGFNEEDPYKGIGHLFRQGELSVNHNCFNQITDFLKNFDTLCRI